MTLIDVLLPKGEVGIWQIMEHLRAGLEHSLARCSLIPGKCGLAMADLGSDTHGVVIAGIP